MSELLTMLSLTGAVLLLLAVTAYQRYMFHKGIQRQLKNISDKLADILEQDSNEQIMVFTDDKVLQSL